MLAKSFFVYGVEVICRNPINLKFCPKKNNQSYFYYLHKLNVRNGAFAIENQGNIKVLMTK